MSNFFKKGLGYCVTKHNVLQVIDNDNTKETEVYRLGTPIVHHSDSIVIICDNSAQLLKLSRAVNTEKYEYFIHQNNLNLFIIEEKKNG